MNAKSTAVAYVLLFTLGVFGGHQFYIGKVGRGVGYLVTGAWFGVGAVIDLFTLPSQIRTVNAIRGAERVLAQHAAVPQV